MSRYHDYPSRDGPSSSNESNNRQWSGSSGSGFGREGDRDRDRESGRNSGGRPFLTERDHRPSTSGSSGRGGGYWSRNHQGQRSSYSGHNTSYDRHNSSNSYSHEQRGGHRGNYNHEGRHSFEGSNSSLNTSHNSSFNSSLNSSYGNRRESRENSGDLQRRTLKVTNFDGEKVTRDLLMELFIQVGPVVNIAHRSDHAFVEFVHEDSVSYALASLKGVTMYGRPLSIEPRINDPWYFERLNTLNFYEQRPEMFGVDV